MGNIYFWPDFCLKFYVSTLRKMVNFLALYKFHSTVSYKLQSTALRSVSEPAAKMGRWLLQSKAQDFL